MRTVFLASMILACTWTSAMGADKPSKTLYVQCEALPVQVGEKFPGHVLRRGDSVTVSGTDSMDLILEFLLDGKTVRSPIQDRVLTNLMALKLLEETKPPVAVAPPPPADAAESPAPAAESPAPAAKPPTDEARLQGTWLLVNYSICGKLNPGPDVEVDVPNEVLSSLIPGFPPGMNMEMFGPAQPAGQGRSKIPALMLQPKAVLYTFADKKLTVWEFIPTIDKHDKLAILPRSLSLYNEFQLNAEVTPKQLDMQRREQNEIDSQTEGIYTFDGELLKVALPATLLGAMPPMGPPFAPGAGAAPAVPRPAGFEDAAANRSMVYWLMRVEGPNVPEPPKPERNSFEAPSVPPGSGGVF